MTRIVTRLIVLGILTTLCVAGMIVSVLLINERSLQDGYLINIAGKERMLTQKITKEVFLMNAKNLQDSVALNDAINEFERNLKILRFGDVREQIKPPRSQIIINKLDSICMQWKDFKSVVEHFKEESAKLYVHRNFTSENNFKLLGLSDKIVKIMVKKNYPAQVLDDLGQQRMLTQRMGYLLIRYANTWEESVYRDFKTSYILYDSTINRLYSSKIYAKDRELKNAIDEAYTFWKEYARHIQSILNTQEKIVADLRLIAKKNTEFLNEIDWMVNLYSDVSIHSRAYLDKFQYGASVIMLLLALYSLYNLLKISRNLKGFVQQTELLASGNIKGNLAQVMQFEGESELSVASQNISRFLQQIEKTKETSNQAIYLSEVISDEVASITSEIRKKLANAQISEAKRKSIENAINLGEDIAIQSSEKLIVVARLLEKLHKILKEIENC